MVQRRNKSHHVPVCFDVFKMLFCQGFWNTIGQRLLLSRLGLAARHYGHMPEITLTGPDTAEGIWYFQDWALHIPTNTVMDGNGIIHDHYRKEKGQWRICCYSYRCVVETVYP